MSRQKSEVKKELLKDLYFMIIGGIIALFLTYSGIIRDLVDILGNDLIASFISGIFFTSILTVAPAAVVLGELSETLPNYMVVIVGALGAVCGDLVLFLFIRHRLSKDVLSFIRPHWVKKILKFFHFGFLKWLAPVVGAVSIALPIPDEIGLALLGVSRSKLYYLLPVIFVMNMIGIIMIIWIKG